MRAENPMRPNASYNRWVRLDVVFPFPLSINTELSSDGLYNSSQIFGRVGPINLSKVVETFHQK